jgi:chloramphenicol-sensitive protein RarD
VHERDLEANRTRVGAFAGLAAYSLWGVFPLVFHQLGSVTPVEILFHRVVWSFVVVVVLVVVGRQGPALRAVVRDRAKLLRLTAAGFLVATNWLVYIWAVNHDRVVEAALGYYVNPLITVALGVAVLQEHLRRAQLIALGFGAAAVAVLTVAYGRLPWIALVLAVSFAGYGYLKKAVSVQATVSLAIETAVLLPIALVGLGVLEASGDAAFLNGSGGRDLLLVSLGVVTAVPLLLFGAAASRIPLSLLGLLQYLTPTLQLLCGVVVLGEDLPPERLAGFVLVWIALAVLGVDALRAGRSAPALEPIAEPV